MELSRRNFFKVAAGGGAVLASNFGALPAQAGEPKARLPEALGILYDATLCVGCKACMAACKQYNHLPPDHSVAGSVWDNPIDLSAKTYNIVKLYKNGSGQMKDREINGYSYIRRFCMHCVDPSCISACPVAALSKDPQTGIVHYNKDVCIGCRYCMVACPYIIPKFQWDLALPQIKKCQLCEHRINEGGYAACCEFCPNGASIFGLVQDLRKEAKRRLALRVGETAIYPLHHIESNEYRYRTVSTTYQPRVYGEKEGGGSQVLILAGVPYQKLGLPALPEASNASKSETLMHSLYKGMIGPYVILGGLFYLVFKNTSKQNLP